MSHQKASAEYRPGDLDRRRQHGHLSRANTKAIHDFTVGADAGRAAVRLRMK